jgi:hypothetical protein
MSQNPCNKDQILDVNSQLKAGQVGINGPDYNFSDYKRTYWIDIFVMR